ICRTASNTGLGRHPLLGQGRTSSLWLALPSTSARLCWNIGVIPQKRAVGITASLGHPAKSLPSYSAWYLAGEVASVRRRVGGWQTRSEPEWPISVDYRMRKRASCPFRFRTFQRPAGRSELAGVLSLPKRRSLEMNHSGLLHFPPRSECYHFALFRRTAKCFGAG